MFDGIIQTRYSPVLAAPHLKHFSLLRKLYRPHWKQAIPECERASLTEEACLITSVTYRIAEPVFKLVSVVAVVHGHSLALNAQQLLEEQDRFLVISSPEKVWSQPKNNHISHAGLGWGSPGRVNVYVRVCVCVWDDGVCVSLWCLGPECPDGAGTVSSSPFLNTTHSLTTLSSTCANNTFLLSFTHASVTQMIFYYLIYEFLPPL